MTQNIFLVGTGIFDVELMKERDIIVWSDHDELVIKIPEDKSYVETACIEGTRDKITIMKYYVKKGMVYLRIDASFSCYHLYEKSKSINKNKRFKKIYSQLEEIGMSN